MTEDLLLRALERPAELIRAEVAVVEGLIRAPTTTEDLLERSLGCLAAVVYARPDLLDQNLAAALSDLFGGASRSAAIYQAGAEVLACRLAQPPAGSERAVVLDLLKRPGLPPAAYGALLEPLEVAATWSTEDLDLAMLLDLAETEHLAPYRGFLLERIVERVLFVCPDQTSSALLTRLCEVGRDLAVLKYWLSYLAGRPGVQAAVRAAAETELEGRFPLRNEVSRLLGGPAPRVLVVQNIRDAQGDEIIRLVMLLESLLAHNRGLEVVLLTARGYLYNPRHPRLRVVPLADTPRVESALAERYEVVVECFEPVVPAVNYDLDLAARLQDRLRQQPPGLYLAVDKGWNHFLYRRLVLQQRSYEAEPGLDRPRALSVYEPTLRLIAELGLPLRIGEEPPPAETIIGGLPCPEAERVWERLTAGNTERRPVALVNPFGGAEPLKGYHERQCNELAADLAGLIAEGYYLVLLPTGTAWGSAALAARALSRLSPAERAQVVVAPDPADGDGVVTYESAGGPLTAPRASYVMRLFTVFARLADLVVAVEGWLMHVAYALGKPCRVVVRTYSGSPDWLPHARTPRQRFVNGLSPERCITPWVEPEAPPLAAGGQQRALQTAIRSLGAHQSGAAIPLLRRLLRSEDRTIRRMAAAALGRQPSQEVEADLLALLRDPANGVRAAAAAALLEQRERAGEQGAMERRVLQAHVCIGQEPRDWRPVVDLGEAARPALLAALQDDDPVVRREASWILSAQGKRPGGAGEAEVARAAGRQSGGAAEVLSRLAVWRRPEPTGRQAPRTRPARPAERVLILTPVKNASPWLAGYVRRLESLSFPHTAISVGLLEGDSDDGTWEQLQEVLPKLRRAFRRAGAWKRDFGYRLPPGLHRGAEPIQTERRTVLARSRNHLLFHALDDEDWVLWLDVDVVEYPVDLIERLLATGKEIVQPHCVLEYGGPTFDRNGWRDQGRLHLDDLRAEGQLVELDAVGGTVLLVRTDLHRDGLIFPAFQYGRPSSLARPGRGELETEGLGILARDMGYQAWGLPHLEVLHANH